MRKTAYYGNEWIGMFIRTNNSRTFVPIDSSKKMIETIVENLKTECIKTTIADSSLIGAYTLMNSNGIIIPNIVYQKEIDLIKKETDLNVYMSKDKHNSIGSNIVANDKGGLINPDMNKTEKKKIEDALGIELVPTKIANYSTLGSIIIANNSGFLTTFRTERDEMKIIEDALKVKGLSGTINMGVGFLSIGVVENDNGYIVGRSSSSYEMGRIEEALEYLK